MRLFVGFCALVALFCSSLATAQTSILWKNASDDAWLKASNWTGVSIPTGVDTAQFGTDPTSATLGVGINMGGSTNNGAANQAVGAIEITSARTNNFLIGNSAASTAGTLTLNGATVNSVANTILRHNGGTAAAPTTFTIQNTQGAGGSTMGVALVPSNSVIQIATGTGATGANYGNTIAITSNISGASKAITLQGGGDSTNRGGTLTLGGTNSFSGGMTVGTSGGTNAGRVRISTAASLPTAGNITVHPDSQLRLDASGGASYGNAAQTMTLNSLGAASGSVSNIDNGGLRYDPAATGSAIFNPAITLTGTSGIHVENSANTLTMASVISGSGFGVTKTGAGNLILNATNTHSGTTTVTGGTLTLASTGSIANSSTIDVQTGATYNVSAVSGYSVGASQTIKGNGTVTGPMSVSGTVAPGASAGTLTVNDNVTMQNSSVYSWELNNPSPAIGAQNTGNSDSAGLQDRLAITGGANTLLAGNITFKVSELTIPTFTFGNNYSWTVATTQATPTLGTVTFDTTSAPVITAWGGAAKLALTVSGNNVYLNLTTVPEPATVLGFCAVAGMAGTALRRRFRKPATV